MTVYTYEDNFGTANTHKGSWKLTWRYTYGELAVGGFPSFASARAYNEKHYADPDPNGIGLLCHVQRGDPWEKIYRNEAGEVIET